MKRRTKIHALAAASVITVPLAVTSCIGDYPTFFSAESIVLTGQTEFIFENYVTIQTSLFLIEKDPVGSVVTGETFWSTDLPNGVQLNSMGQLVGTPNINFDSRSAISKTFISHIYAGATLKDRAPIYVLQPLEITITVTRPQLRTIAINEFEPSYQFNYSVTSAVAGAGVAIQPYQLSVSPVPYDANYNNDKVVYTNDTQSMSTPNLSTDGSGLFSGSFQITSAVIGTTYTYVFKFVASIPDQSITSSSYSVVFNITITS